MTDYALWTCGKMKSHQLIELNCQTQKKKMIELKLGIYESYDSL